jgi:TetR/AcrR family transcriptional repressor of mexJK operon
MNATSTMRRGAGRPTSEQAEARHGELLDAALDLFLEHGFELTTIEMIAARINMTKRTVYARYPDKASRYRAADRSAGRARGLRPRRPGRNAGIDCPAADRPGDDA